ncbi:MAG: hypothetical protein COA57_05555 [Flavobacteriales bacterium]|nr:MAG: hypothetical protein COA57_05555 [Flavobacteriales bacterium]
MRKSSIIFFLFFLSIQSFSQSRFKAGFLAGLTTSQINGDGYAGFNKIGPIIGVFVNSDIKEKWQVQFEINYINKGSKDPPNHEIGKYNFTRINLHYIEVPVLAKYYWKKFNFQLGVTLGTLAKERWTDANGKIPAYINFKRYELGYLAGVSWEATKSLTLNWRYQSSLLPVANRVTFDPVRFGFFGGSHNIGILLTLRYEIPLQKSD